MITADPTAEPKTTTIETDCLSKASLYAIPKTKGDAATTKFAGGRAYDKWLSSGACNSICQMLKVMPTISNEREYEGDLVSR